MFKLVVESLLKGEFICAQTNEKAFHFLNEESKFSDVEQFCQRLDKVLLKTETETAFFLGFRDLECKGNRNDITEQFKIFRSNLRPILEFIQLIMNSENIDSPLLAGDPISLAQITAKVESDELLAGMLQNIIRTSPKKLKGGDINKSISNVFDFMCEQGLLIQTIKEAKIFQVTGKIGYFYEVTAFIGDREEIQQKIELQENKQSELLL